MDANDLVGGFGPGWGRVTDTLNIPIIHADGEDDEVRFEYTDTNAKNWK